MSRWEMAMRMRFDSSSSWWCKWTHRKQYKKPIALLWYIYLHEWLFFYGFHVGKYTIHMDCLGNLPNQTHHVCREGPTLLWRSTFQRIVGPVVFLHLKMPSTYCSCFRNPAKTHLGCFWNLVNNGINYQPRLVLAGFLNHQYVSTSLSWCFINHKISEWHPPWN